MIYWWTAIPFVVMLVAIAVLPLLPATRHWWDRPSHQLLVSVLLGAPTAAAMIAAGHGLGVAEALVEYGQFVILLFGLFVVAGGLALTGDLAGTPKVNAVFLGLGALLASLIGTTGAAMLLIRPLLISNAHRRHRTHIVIFAIFMMANCGGLLTPLGDPPLFLGFLRGVPFAWTLGLAPQWLLVNGLLLLTFVCLDSALMADDDRTLDVVEPWGIVGKLQIIWFVVIVAAVALVPSTNLEAALHQDWAAAVPWRELVVLAAAGASWLTSPKRARFEINHFTFTPILEVAALFVGIFVTMVPALLLLEAHAGAMRLGPVGLHLLTGGFTSVLDNAPTYATFFEIAKASPQVGPLVAGVSAADLAAISTGAVFFGAMTYIGNGPNFMVRAVAVSRGVPMPSFVGYLAWSVRWLLPVLVASMLVFTAQPWWAKLAGGVLAALLAVRALLVLRRARRSPTGVR